MNSYNQKIVAKIKEQDAQIAAISDRISECELEKKIVTLTEQEAKLNKRIQKVLEVALAFVFFSLISIIITVFTLLKLLYLG